MLNYKPDWESLTISEKIEMLHAVVQMIFDVLHNQSR